MDDIYFGEEDIRYVKPKSKKKKIEKSKHKHIYDKYCAAVISKSCTSKDVLIKYCGICGKIGNQYYFANQETTARLKKNGRYFEVEDSNTLFNMKYVPISWED